MDWLRQYRPDLVERYERLYGTGAYLPKNERERLAKLARGGRRPRRFIGKDAPVRRTHAAAADPPSGVPEVHCTTQPKLF
jgi:hypothetical protein